MGKYLRNMLGLLAIAMMASCARYTCPTYFDTYNHQPGAANEFFNYFKSTESQGFASGGGDAIASTGDGFLDVDGGGDIEDDMDLGGGYVSQKDTFKTENGMLILPDGEEPVEGKLFGGKPRGKNGLASQKLFLGGIFSRPAKRRARNTPKVVKMITKPDKKKDTEEDSTSTQELLYPPEATDQFYYNLEMGNPVADSTQADSSDTAEADSLGVEDEFGEFGDFTGVDEGEEEYETDKKGRLKKKKIKKKDKNKEPKEKKKDKKKDKPKKEKAKKEKPKKEKKNKEEEEPDDGMARQDE